MLMHFLPGAYAAASVSLWSIVHLYLFCTVHTDSFRVYSEPQPDVIHYLALTNVLGRRTYAICLTQYTKHSVSKVTGAVNTSLGYINIYIYTIDVCQSWYSYGPLGPFSSCVVWMQHYVRYGTVKLIGWKVDLVENYITVSFVILLCQKTHQESTVCSSKFLCVHIVYLIFWSYAVSAACYLMQWHMQESCIRNVHKLLELA